MVLFKIDHVWKQIPLVSCVNFGEIMVGYSVSWTSPVVPKLQDPSTTPLSEILSFRQASWIGSTFTIGLVIGFIVVALLSNKFGRKPCIMIGGTLTAVSYFVILLTKSYILVLAMRMFSGLAASLMAVGNIIYIGEISSPNIRGVMLTSTGVAHAFGVLMVNAIGLYMSYAEIIYILLLLAFISFLGYLFIPESPEFLLIKGENERASKIIDELGRTVEFQNIEEMKNQSSKTKPTLKAMLAMKHNRKSLLIVTALVIFQVNSGMIVVLEFTQSIFKSVELVIEPAIATLILCFTQLICTIIVPCFVDKAGRKKMLLISTTGCCVFQMLLGIYYYLEYNKYSIINSIRWLPIPALVLVCCSFTVGLNIIPNTMIGELFNVNFRGVGSAISLSIAWIFATVTIVIFGYIIDFLGLHVAFWMFSVINGLGLAYSLRCVPETKGMTLAEIQEMMIANTT